MRAAPIRLDRLREACELLVRELDASACTVSRIIGDVLVQVAEHTGRRPTAAFGHGFLIADYPLTRRVLELREPATVTVDGPDDDAREIALLEALGFGALLMLPLEVRDELWGLVEVYDEPARRFTDAEVAHARRLTAAAAAALGAD